MHGGNIRLGRDSKQRPRPPKANTITTELKAILPYTAYTNLEAAMLEGVVSRNNSSKIVRGVLDINTSIWYADGYMDGHTDGGRDKLIPVYLRKHSFCGGINIYRH